MLWTHRQHAFTGGRLDKELMGRQDIEQYYKGACELKNFTVKRQGNISKRRGSEFLIGNFVDNWNPQTHRIIPIVTTSSNGYYLLFAGPMMSIIRRKYALNNIWYGGTMTWKSGYTPTQPPNTSRLEWKSGTLTAEEKSRIYTLDSGLGTFDHRKMDYCQCGDVMYITCAEHRPIKVTFVYSGDGMGTDEKVYFTVENVDLNTERYSQMNMTSVQVNKPPMNPQAEEPYDTWPSDSGHKKVFYTAVWCDKDGYESYPATKIGVTYGLPWPAEGTITVTAQMPNYGSMPSSLKNKFSQVKFYKHEGGGFGYIGSEKEVASNGTVTFTDTYISPDLTTTPRDPKSVPDFVSNANKYPQKVSLYQQRIAFARNNENPFTVWLSASGRLEDFSTHESIQANDAITATLAATELPMVNHILTNKDLIALTEGGEWIISPVTGNALTPTSCQAKLQSTIGTQEGVKPISVGSEVVFTDQSGERVLATQYDYMTDGYISNDLSEMSHWMFNANKVLCLAYRKCPDSVVYALLKNGEIGTMTYVKEQKLNAWSRMTFGSGWKCVGLASNKSINNGSTEMVFVMQDANGNVEIWSERDDTTVADGLEIENLVCLDGCRWVTSGYTIPEGMIGINIHTGQEYSAGRTLTTDEESIVGVRIVSKMETVYPDTKGSNGEAQGETLNPTEAVLRVIHGTKFYAGLNVLDESHDMVKDIGPALTVHGTGVGRATAWFADKYVRVILTGTNSKDHRIRVRHEEPWPFTILSVATTFQVEAQNLNGGGQ